MIATRSVERSRSALHKSTQLHSRRHYSITLYSRLLKNNNINNITINCCCSHNAPTGRLFQSRLAHTSVPFGWTNIDQKEEPNPLAFSKPPSQPHGKIRPLPPGITPRPSPLRPTEKAGHPGSVSYYHAALKSLFSALRQGDTFKLYLCLMSLVRGHETETGSHAFTEVMASIPATTFSEILRNFDPHKVAEEIDTAPGLNISYGMAVHTPLGELVNKWGVKTLYVRILRRLLYIQVARRKSGLAPLMNDYVVLMRCAGATSDIRAAKDIWYSMHSDRRANIRHSKGYSEFIKARYLAEKIYANNDLSRLRLRPLDMHRSSLKLPGTAKHRLLKINAHITDRRKHRFGSNMHERFFDEPLTMLLRKRDPLMKLERTAALRGFKNVTEDFVCAVLKANSRAGRMTANRSLLMKNWGLIIKRDRKTGAIAIEGGHTYSLESPRAPTAALLDAIVHSYCSMGEITLAVRLLDYISQRFSIPVPDHVWSDLIEYTRVMESRPVATEWAIANFPHRGARANQVLEVWSLCTQAPYSFRPGARDYYNLIRSLVRKSGSMVKPIEALRQIKPLYNDAVDACEQAWCELMQTTQQAVPNHSAYRRYRVLQARRNHMWYMFHYSTHLILKGVRAGRIDDDSAVREIPNLVGDFAQFLPRKVSYSVATGDIEFCPDPVRRKDVVKVDQIVVEAEQPGVEAEQTVVERPPAIVYSRLYALRQRKGNIDVLREYQLDDLSEDNEYLGTGKDETSGSDEPVLEDEPGPGDSVKSRRAVEWGEAEKPAYLHRPRYSGPSDQPSILSIRRDGGEFTGYHDDPLRRHFAAYRVEQRTERVAGVPVELEWRVREKGKEEPHPKLVEEMLRVRT